MLVQKKTQSKTRLPLLIVAGILLVATLGVAYWTYFSPSGTSGLGAPSPASGATFSTNLDTSVLNDSRLKNLTMHGDAQVNVQQLGRKAPFQPF